MSVTNVCLSVTNVCLSVTNVCLSVTLVCLFVCNNPSPCKVSMVLSGDLVAPLTVSAAPEACPTGSPRQGSLALGYSTDVPCPTASCVEGSGKHGSQTPTGRTTLQSIFAHSSLCFISIGPPYQRSLMRSEGLAWLRNQRLCKS